VIRNAKRPSGKLGLFNPPITNEFDITNYARLVAVTNTSATLQDRARSYIDANCAQCHRPGGPQTTFDARYDTPLTNQNIIDGVLVKGDLGYDNARVVVPKDILRSVLYDRMNTVDSLIKMPQLARNVIDTNAVNAIADWINSLPGTPALAPPAISPPGGSGVGSLAVTIQHSDTSARLYFTVDGSLPTTSSTLYTGPVTLTNSVTLKAVAFDTGFNNSIAACFGSDNASVCLTHEVAASVGKLPAAVLLSMFDDILLTTSVQYRAPASCPHIIRKRSRKLTYLMKF